MGLYVKVRPNLVPIVLGVGSLVAYAVGYPLAIVSGYEIGWALVTLGGVLLLALGFVAVRRIHRATSRR